MCCAVCGPEPGRIGEVTPLGPCPAQHRGGPLRPSELAQASVMAALCAVTAIISVVVPFAAGLALLGTVPTACWPTATVSACWRPRRLRPG